MQELKSRVPPGVIWATPDRPEGYLRRSALRSLARGVNDQGLPEDLVAAGTFEDTVYSPSSTIRDTVTTIELGHRLTKKFQGRLEELEEEGVGS